ncbi:hypothetical protein [Pseudolactococcus reticulitermitis]|uniref:Lipoprotein n=1 Tax=Pseudolactococcus reticulitermitis TaxID=2025039 RepID=A0A224XFK2_9LACT|nr:hypothetical protein [Lactococcus reticulitermitis]GAX48323.1 hypothetical protein RsY01_1939 [Lactococcus reticulitermitis]
MKKKVLYSLALIVVCLLLTSCSSKNALKFQKGDYLPVLTSKNNIVIENLEKKGIKSDWGKAGFKGFEYGDDKLRISKNGIDYYFDVNGATDIYLELPFRYVHETINGDIVEDFEGSGNFKIEDGWLEELHIEIESIYTTGDVEEISITVHGGMDNPAYVYKMANLDKPLRTIPALGKTKVGVATIKSYLPNSEVKKIIKQCEEFQADIKNVTLEK